MSLCQGKDPAPDSLAAPPCSDGISPGVWRPWGHPKANLGHLVPGPALEWGSAKAGQIQTSRQRAGRREPEAQLGRGRAGEGTARLKPEKWAVGQ